MTHLATPAEEEALAGLNNNQLVRQSYINSGSGVVLQAEVLKRFSQLNRDYRELEATHGECESVSDRLKAVEEERDVQIAKFETLLKELRALEDEQQEERAAASTREKGLIDQLEEIEKEKNEATSLSAS